MLQDETAYSQASQLCNFISTLCVESELDECHKESSLCSSVANYCLDESRRKETRETCNIAKKLCPKNYLIDGS
ncbi:MAG: hypothetical protein QXJ75_04180 [Candidatus Bathyarchaeia archaeon]